MRFPTSFFPTWARAVNIGPDRNAPQFTIQNFYRAYDNFSWTKGRHTLKFGGEYR